MTENKTIMEKKNLNLEKSKDVPLQSRKEKRLKSKKQKQVMKKRLIIRNLSFKVTEEELKKIFSKFGEVLEVNIPVNEAGRKRGFAFVRFKDSKSQILAMKALNFKEICGRPVAIDFAVDKTTYQSQHKNTKPTTEPSKNSRLNESDSDSEDGDTEPKPNIKVERCSDSEDDENDEEDNKVSKFLKEFNADKESDTSNESSDDSDIDENESHHSNEEVENAGPKKGKSEKKEKKLSDVSEGKTIFIRNLSFKNSEEDLQEVMEEYGEIVYCLLCTDPVTDHPKGTAFVKFKEKESADKLVEESAKEPGIILDGRKLMCTYAVTAKELSKNDESLKSKDKRNLRLLKCGLIAYGFKESEGVSQTDMAKRAQLEVIKKQKLKNVNFFVSDIRLAVHNIPKNITDKDLRILFKKAGGKGAVVKEARVMKDFKKTNSQGIPVSRGFGFVSFTEHKHALKALTELNNNPNIFTDAKRPIVEFSVENKVALLSQERKREKLKWVHKKKLEEKLMKSQQTDESTDQRPSDFHFKRKRNGSETNNFHNKKMRKQDSLNNSSSQGTQEKISKKKQKKNQKNKKKKGNTMNTQDRKSLSVLTDKYKKKLSDKFS